MTNAFTGFFNGPNHMYNTIGSYVLSIALVDLNGNSDSRSVTINVAQGPNLPSGVYGSGGKSPLKI